MLNVAYKITTMLSSRVTGVRWALAGEKYIQILKSFPGGIDRFCITFFGLSFLYLWSIVDTVKLQLNFNFTLNFSDVTGIEDPAVS